MRPFLAAELLNIWERGTGHTPVEQALAILSIAFPQTPHETLAKLNVVQRDLCLLELRRLTFGSQINGRADCPACGQRLDLDFDIGDLPASTSVLPDLELIKLSKAENSFHTDNYEVTFRLPTSLDLSIVGKLLDQTARRQKLLEACVLSVQCDGKSLLLGDLSPDAIDALIEHMSQENSISNLTLPVTCPECSATWEILFDIVSYFWGEITAWSMRLMHEVHMLATAYGWGEADILAMSARRRQGYLNLIGV
jgi:T4 bacteriophage base plate protein